MNDWFVLFHTLGAVQGFFLAAVLLGRRSSVSSRLLGLTMLAFGVDLLMAVYHATGSHEAFPALIGLDYPLAFVYGPLLLLYATAVGRRESTFPRQRLWHFLPFAALCLGLVPFFLQSGAAKLDFMQAGAGTTLDGVLSLVNNLKLVHAFVYITLTMLFLRRHASGRRQTTLTDQVNLVWLRNLMTAIVVMMIATVALHLLGLQNQGGATGIGLDPGSVYDDYTLLVLAVAVYAIGFMGLRQAHVFHKDDPVDTPPQYARSGLDPETAEDRRRHLETFLERERPYLLADLTLQGLADAVGMSPHHLTEVINTRLGVSFRELINGYRVREVQERLVSPEYAHLSILAIGLDSGFQSKSSFNAAFRKHVGMTPSAYRAQFGS